MKKLLKILSLVLLLGVLWLQLPQRVFLNGCSAGFFPQSADGLGDLLINAFDPAEKFCGRHPQNAASQGRELDQSIRGSHMDGVVLTDLGDQSLYIHIRALIFLRIDHAKIVVLGA